jgi:thiol-disulfide isomerase/thioredoxin
LAKKIITATLLIFALGSLGYMVIYELVSKPAEITEISNSNTTLDANEKTSLQEQKVVVYYFFGNIRCETCHKLESYAQESLQNNFADEIKAGLIEWKPVNTDETQNRHFIKDYELVSKSIVLSNTLAGKEVSWKNLDKIWELVGNKDKYVEYIKVNVAEFLKEQPQ